MEQVAEGQGGRAAGGLGWAGGAWGWLVGLGLGLAGGPGGWWLAARWHGGMAQDVVIGFDVTSFYTCRYDPRTISSYTGQPKTN